MSVYPVFLSVVLVSQNQSHAIENILKKYTALLQDLVTDYEIIIVDNASTDESFSVLEALTKEQGLPNLQVYFLTQQVDQDIGTWVGVESALGDFVVTLNPLTDDLEFVSKMLDKAMHDKNIDVVFADNQEKPIHNMSYKLAQSGFNWCYKVFTGVNLKKDAPRYRLLNKKVINFIFQHNQPSMMYRHLPATGGFVKANLSYRFLPKMTHKRGLREGLDRGLRLLVSSTRGPMRFVTSLCLFGAFANFVYSVYVVLVGLFKVGVEPGWVSLSLQQSGMFFLLSLVLLVLSEYMLHMAGLASGGPVYHVARELTSARMTRKEKLNIETGDTP